MEHSELKTVQGLITLESLFRDYQQSVVPRSCANFLSILEKLCCTQSSSSSRPRILPLPWGRMQCTSFRLTVCPAHAPVCVQNLRPALSRVVSTHTTRRCRSRHHHTKAPEPVQERWELPHRVQHPHTTGTLPSLPLHYLHTKRVPRPTPRLFQDTIIRGHGGPVR